MFDNGSDPPKEKQSRGLLLDPNVATRTVTLVKQFVNPSRTLLATSQGNLASLPGGDWLMGYGGLPNFTEYDDSGRVLLDGTLGKNVQSFRTYLAPWSGQPATAPAVVARPGVGGTIAASMSWNGATEVASWRVLAGSSPSALAAGRQRRADRLSDDDRGARRGAVRGRAGARRRRCGDRHVGHGQGLAPPARATPGCPGVLAVTRAPLRTAWV